MSSSDTSAQRSGAVPPRALSGADRRTDGPTLLQARVASSSRRWGRRSTMTVRVTSRCLHWQTGTSHESVEWTSVRAVEAQDGALRVEYVDDADRPQVLVVELEGPLGFLVAEDVQRRAQAAARNVAAAA